MISAMTSKNKNGGNSMRARLVFRYDRHEKSEGEAYILSFNANKRFAYL